MFKCERCHNEYYEIFGSGRFCSKSCANSRGPRTDEFKKKIHLAFKIKRLSPITCVCKICNSSFSQKKKTQKYCSRLCARKNNIKSAKKSQKENSPNWSVIHRKSYESGKNFVSGGTTKWLQYKEIKVQGSYELRMCYILDAMKEVGHITNWEYTSDRFSYIAIDKTKRNYLLDFKVFIDENNYFYIETKGRITDNDYLKWEAVRSCGYRLDILDNTKIKNLELKYNIRYTI
jgi:hypothetical protein